MSKHYSEDQSIEQAVFIAKEIKKAINPSSVSIAISKIPDGNLLTNDERSKLSRLSNDIEISDEPNNTITKKPDGLYVPAKFDFSIVTKDLISSDADNNLQLGSDNKLLSRPNDTDFLADYILASN